jgi:hypothetical protein
VITWQRTSERQSSSSKQEEILQDLQYTPCSVLNVYECVSYLSSLWPNTWQKQPKGGRTYFGSQFQRFHYIGLGSVDSGPVVRWNVMVVGGCIRVYSPHDRLEAERETGRSQEHDTPRTCPQWPASSSWVLPPKVSRTSQINVTSWEPSTQHMSLWGDISYSNHRDRDRERKRTLKRCSN